ncbi:MAG: radical SAM peptide maturase [Candidatus Aminicenantes bacterium]|nr:radical SAM peptide maturase [Candidatus Aminicenantes bacterium]
MKKLKSGVLFDSKQQNKYFYDRSRGTTMLCHPLLYYLLEKHNRGIDVPKWFEQAISGEAEPVFLDGYGSVSRQELDYYYRKFSVFRENGFFDEADLENLLSGRLKAEDIKIALANLKQVILEVTDACNLECAYCGYGKFYQDYDRRENKFMDPEAAKAMVDYILELADSPLNYSHQRGISIGFYGGEPLLNFPFIKEMVDYVGHLKPRHNYFTFSMTTNGLLLERYMDFLVEHKFNLLVSLDGDEHSNSYRVCKDGSPAYPHIMRNARALSEMYPDYFKKNVNFNAVFHNRNSVSTLHRFFKEEFDTTPGISELNTSGIKDSMKEEFRRTYANVNESLHQAEDYALIEKEMFIRLPNIRSVGTFIDQYSGFGYRDYNDLISTHEGMKRIPTSTCQPFSKKVFLTVNGKILPCEQIGQQYGLGLVNEQGVKLDFEKIAALYNNYYDKLKKQCTACAAAQMCLQCMFYLDIEADNPHCAGLMVEKDISDFLSSQVSYLEEKPETYTRIMKEVAFE